MVRLLAVATIAGMIVLGLAVGMLGASVGYSFVFNLILTFLELVCLLFIALIWIEFENAVKFDGGVGQLRRRYGRFPVISFHP